MRQTRLAPIRRFTLVLLVALSGCGGSSGPHTGFIQMERAPDEWFQAFASGAQKLGCELKDMSNDPDNPPGMRIMWARCPDRNLIGTLLDGDGGTTAMCDAIDKRDVSDVECATFLDEVMNAGRAS